MKTHKENFERLWDKFFVKLQGKIMKTAGNQELTYPLMNLILTDAKSDWTTEYDECGRWLKNYMEENPAKGRLVSEILTDNMSFREVPKKNDSMGVVGVVAPIAAAAVGFGVSTLLDASVWIKVLSTVLPAGLILGTTKSLSPKFKDKRLKEQINGYLEQLEKYKQSVISVLSD